MREGPRRGGKRTGKFRATKSGKLLFTGRQCAVNSNVYEDFARAEKRISLAKNAPLIDLAAKLSCFLVQLKMPLPQRLCCSQPAMR